MAYLKNMVIAVDQLVNTFIGGWPDETMSSYAYRMEAQSKPWGFMRRVIDTLFFWELYHCRDSFTSERERLQSPPEER